MIRMRTKENRQLDKTQRIENSIKQTTKSVAHMNLGCRFSFWLLVDSRCLNSILPKKKQEQSYWGNGGFDTRWYAHAYATRVASCVARSSRRIRELDNLSLRDLVKRQCTARLSTRRTTESITHPRTDEAAHTITPCRCEGTNWVNRNSAFYNSLRNRKNKCCKPLKTHA